MSAGRRALAREFLLFGSSTTILQGARFAYSLAVASAVPVTALTAWALLLAAIGYAPALLLGVVNGMSRDLPYLIGAGRLTEARVAEATTWATFGAVVVCVAVGGLVASLAGVAPIDAVAVGLALVMSIGYLVQQFAMRSRLAFNRASAQQAVFGLGILPAGAWLLLRGHAAFVEATLLYAVACGIAVGAGLVLQPPNLSGATQLMWRRLFGVGFPIMLGGAVFSIFVTSDRWIATTLLGAAAAAPYALASLVGSATLVLPTVISQQTYPRMAIAYGERHDGPEVLGMARRQNRTAFALTAPLALLVGGAAALLIPRFLPQYTESVVPIGVIVMGLAALAAFTGYGNYLIVIGAQWAYLRSQLAGLAAAVVTATIGGMLIGLNGVALGIAAGYLVYGLLVARTARREFDVRFGSRGLGPMVARAEVEELGSRLS